MKILWMNDLDLEKGGGAEKSSLAMVRAGELRGHEITLFSPQLCAELSGLTVMPLDNFNLSYFDKFDLIVLNNINMFPLSIIEHIINNKKYIKYEHDYCYCAYRNGTCGISHSLCIPAEVFVKMFSNSKLNIFFSPIQLQVFRKVFKEVLRDAIIIPAPIKEGMFYPVDVPEGKIDYLYAGVIAEHKGLSKILDFADEHPEWKFHFAGNPIDQKLMERIKDKHTYLGNIPHEQMPSLYQQYKHFLFNTQMHETFGITLVEAMLSGCGLAKFSGTWKSGMESYGLPINELAEKCYKAPDLFWKEVEKV
jgi:glycosyltransferase involved in cell wall biosynthesis